MTLQPEVSIDLTLKPEDAKSLVDLIKAFRPEKGLWDFVAATDGSGTTDEHREAMRHPGESQEVRSSATDWCIQRNDSQMAEVSAVFHWRAIYSNRMRVKRQADALS